MVKEEPATTDELIALIKQALGARELKGLSESDQNEMVGCTFASVFRVRILIKLKCD